MKLRPVRRLLLVTLAGGAPAVVVAVALVASSDLDVAFAWVLGIVVVASWLGGALTLRNTAKFRLRTLSNLLAALREEDYSFRVRGGRRDDAFGELIVELNLLAQRLRSERFGDVESTALLAKVMAEIDVVVLAFDPERRLQLANRAGLDLLGGREHELIGASADELGLAACLDGPPARTIELSFQTASDRWELRRGTFRQGGRPHSLLVLSNVSRALRTEEVTAWQRLIRVLGHELNNSLAPIKSIAGSLDALVEREPLPSDWRDDVRTGLGIIAARAESLNRLMTAYAQLARLPEPKLERVEVGAWVQRVAALETRLDVEVAGGPQLSVPGDGDQLDQLLINLVRNAVDAALETGGGVTVSWMAVERFLELRVDDEGPGLSNSANVFVPFFTTKPGGTGIGLALARQIAEVHGGTVELANRGGAPGCRATVRLPLRKGPDAD
jgi:two-component system, NtrC family, nitrogen regulation sensor histidine kinase NtrY